MSGRLADNVVHFGRVLRAAGLPVGTDRIRVALDALALAGLDSRDELRTVLRACLTDRVEQHAMFEQAFELFWRDPDLLGRAMAMLLPRIEGRGGAVPPPKENRRLAAALFPQAAARAADRPAEERAEIDAHLTFSDRELLRKADFDTMTPAEWAAAKRLIARRAALLPRMRTRRRVRARSGDAPDWPRTMARAARNGGQILSLAWREPSWRAAPLTALIDVSGSMSRYSRMFLHFLHALIGAERGVHAFLFGTRLTPVTRRLRRRDPDEAVAECVRAVDDWSGGTRIAACLHAFNRDWARRTLSGNATVLLVTDGLERDDSGLLGEEAHRLALSCRRLIWLNPLLRYQGFEPRAAGVRALLPHVDAMLPVHDLDSLDALADVLAAPRPPLRAAPASTLLHPRSPRWN